MKKYFGIWFCLVFVSCSKPVEINFKDYKSVGSAIVQFAEKNDTTGLLQLFNKGKHKPWEVRCLDEFVGFEDYDIRVRNYYKIFAGGNVKILEIDTSIVQGRYPDCYQFDSTCFMTIGGDKTISYFEAGHYGSLKYIVTYAKCDENIYALRTYYIIDSSGTFHPYDFYYTNLNERCQQYQKNPYKAKLNDFVIRQPNFGNFYGMAFPKGKIYIYNQIGYEINQIKFNLILAEHDPWESAMAKIPYKEYFNRTYKVDVIISQNSEGMVEIPELKEFFDYFLRTKNKIGYVGLYCEDVNPKPELFICKKLKELKKLN